MSLRRRMRRLWPKDLRSQPSAGGIVILAGLALIMVAVAMGK